MPQTSLRSFKNFPFLKAISWQVDDLSQHTEDEILNLYERGWIYKGVLTDLSAQEKAFLSELAKAKKSWLINEL